MKIVVIILAVITLLIWVGAGIRLSSSTQDTTPLFSFVGGSKSTDTNTAAAKGKFGETGKGGAVVSHLRGGRLAEMEETSAISTSNPQSNTDYNGTKEMEQAEEITDRRETDLGKAKKKIAIINDAVN